MTQPSPPAPIFRGAPMKGADHRPAGAQAETSLLAPDMDLGQLMAEIWRRKALVAAVTGLVTLAALVVALGTTETYRADATIHIENEKSLGSASDLLSSPAGGKGSEVNTEMELMRSRLILGRVVEEEKLRIVVEPRQPWMLGRALRYVGAPWPGERRFPARAESLSVAALSVPPAWEKDEDEITVVVGENGRYRAILPDDTELEGQAGTALTDAARGVSLLVERIDAAPGREFTVLSRSELDAIEALRDALQLEELGRQTGMIELSFDDDSAAAAERRLKLIVQSYVDNKSSYAKKKGERSLSFVEELIPSTEVSIRAAEERLVDFQRKSNMIDVKTQSEILVKKIEEIGSRLEREQIPREQERLLAIQNKLREEAQQLPINQQQVANLMLELKTKQEIYVELITRVQEMRALLASKQSNVRLVDGAVADIDKVAPRRSLILLIGMVVGLFLGLTIAGFRVIMGTRRPAV